MILIVVLPLVTLVLRLVSGSPVSGLWDALEIFIVMCLIAFIVPALWFGTRPIRRLRAKHMVENPASECDIVTPWNEETGFTAQVLLVANDRGITVLSPTAEPATLGWSDIAEIRDVPSTESRPDLCKISLRNGAPALLFLPMSKSGATAVSWWDFPDFLARLRSAKIDMNHG